MSAPEERTASLEERLLHLHRAALEFNKALIQLAAQMAEAVSKIDWEGIQAGLEAARFDLKRDEIP